MILYKLKVSKRQLDRHILKEEIQITNKRKSVQSARIIRNIKIIPQENKTSCDRKVNLII